MIRPAFVVLAAGMALLPGASPPAETPIAIHGWVTDEHRRPVAGIGRDEVEILVNGAPVPVEAVSPPSHGLSLVLVLDTSRSVRWDREDLARQLTAFAEALGPRDRILLSTVGGRQVTLPFRSARTDWRADVRGALDLDDDEGYGASPLWDRLHDAVTILAKEPAPRAVLLLSDGRATGNRHGLADVAEYAMVHGVSVYVLAKHASQRIRQSGGTSVRTEAAPSLMAVLVQPTAPLEAVAIYTGGQVFVYPDRQPQAAQLLFSTLAGGLGALQAFTFIPPFHDGATHQIEIRLKRPRHRVHAPAAFLAPPG